MHVLRDKNSEGEDYKLLGVFFDCQLKMKGADQAVKELAQEAG